MPRKPTTVYSERPAALIDDLLTAIDQRQGQRVVKATRDVTFGRRKPDVGCIQRRTISRLLQTMLYWQRNLRLKERMSDHAHPANTLLTTPHSLSTNITIGDMLTTLA